MSKSRWHRAWGLYLVADEIHFRKGLVEDALVRAAQGGVQVLQLREKTCSDEEFTHLARRVLRALKPFNIPVIINDRVQVALATGAHGVHLGQSDLHPRRAREILGPRALIGWSVEDESHLASADQFDLDYVGVSSVFATQTKSNLRRIWGLEGLSNLRSLTALPLIGIGGISEENLGSVINSGADAVALISDFRARDDWRTKAQRLRERIENAIARRENESRIFQRSQSSDHRRLR